MYRNCWDNSPYTQNSVKRDGIKVQKVIQKLCLMYHLHISCSCPAMRSIPRYFGPIRQKALFRSDFLSNSQKRIGRFCMNTLISSGKSFRNTAAEDSVPNWSALWSIKCWQTDWFRIASSGQTTLLPDHYRKSWDCVFCLKRLHAYIRMIVQP